MRVVVVCQVLGLGLHLLVLVSSIALQAGSTPRPPPSPLLVFRGLRPEAGRCAIAAAYDYHWRL